jgi:hypothetical protein
MVRALSWLKKMTVDIDPSTGLSIILIEPYVLIDNQRTLGSLGSSGWVLFVQLPGV